MVNSDCREKLERVPGNIMLQNDRSWRFRENGQTWGGRWADALEEVTAGRAERASVLKAAGGEPAGFDSRWGGWGQVGDTVPGGEDSGQGRGGKHCSHLY